MIIFLGEGTLKFEQFEILSILLINEKNSILKQDFPGVLNETQYIKKFQEIIKTTPREYNIVIIAHSAGANISLIDEKNIKILLGMNFDYLPENSIVINGIFDEFHPAWETIKVTNKNYYLTFSNHISELLNPKTAEIITNHLNQTKPNKNIILFYIINQLLIIYSIINIGYNIKKTNPITLIKINFSQYINIVKNFFILLIPSTLLITLIISDKDKFFVFYFLKIIMFISLILFGNILKLLDLDNYKFWIILIAFFTVRTVVSTFYSIPFFINAKNIQNIMINPKEIHIDIFFNIFGNIYFTFLNFFNNPIVLIFIVAILILLKYKKEIIKQKLYKYYLLILSNKTIISILILFSISFILNFLAYYSYDFATTDISRVIQFIGKELMILTLSVYFSKIILLKLNSKFNNPSKINSVTII